MAESEEPPTVTVKTEMVSVSVMESVKVGAAVTWSFTTNLASKCVTPRFLQFLALVLGLVTFYHILVLCGVVSYGKWGESGNNTVLNGMKESVLDAILKSMPKSKAEDVANKTVTRPRGPFMDALEIYKTLPFQEPAFWNSKLEERFTQPKKFPLKIIVSKYYNGEPELDSTSEDYSQSTQRMVSNLLETLRDNQSVLFQWSEASAIHEWWENAIEVDKSALRTFVTQKLEIVTGGWTTPDEAVVNLYSLVDQLIEGQHWFATQLVVFPEAAWSLGSYGHTSVYPYVLHETGIKSALITKTHYAWRKYLAEKQKGDFLWTQRWDIDSDKRTSNTSGHDMLVHQHLCNLDLRVNSHPVKPRKNELGCSELSSFKVPVGASANESEIKTMADLFVHEAGKIGSLSSHNVALITVNGYPKPKDEAAANFDRIMKYVKNHSAEYNLELEFGTFKYYSKEIQKRQKTLPEFVGDLLVYGDADIPKTEEETVKPLYWSGHFSSRPFLKKLYRETEATVRDAEMLYSFVNMATRENDATCFNTKVAEVLYKDLQAARRGLAQFAKKDGKLGHTNPQLLKNRSIKLKEAQDLALKVQLNSSHCLTFLTLQDLPRDFTTNLSSTWSRPNYTALVQSEGLSFDEIRTKRIVLFNSFGWRRAEMVSVEVNKINNSAEFAWFEVMGPNRKFISSQLVPIVELINGKLEFSSTTFKLTFMAELEPFALSVFIVNNVEEKTPFSAFQSVYKGVSVSTNPELLDPEISEEYEYQDNGTPRKKNEISIKNGRLRLILDPTVGSTSMRTMVRGYDKRTWIDINLSFGSYTVKDEQNDPDIFLPKEESETSPLLDTPEKIYVVRGTIITDLVIIKSNIIQTLRLLHTSEEWKEMENAVFIQNQVNTKNNSGEFYMRFDSNLESLNPMKEPIFFTDQSGLSFEKRITIEKLGLPGNTYPLNTMGYIQDDTNGFRLSLLVDRAHGISSFEKGRLEVTIDRYIKDEPSVETISNYVMLLEDLHPLLNSLDYVDTFPTMLAHHLSLSLSYPVPIFKVRTAYLDAELDIDPEFSIIPLFNQELPCHTHILNLRTLFQLTPSVELDIPGLNTLMILQKLGYSYDKFKPDSCEFIKGQLVDPSSLFYRDTKFTTFYQETHPILADLTGLRTRHNGAEDNNEKKDKVLLEDIVSRPFELTSLVIGFVQDGPRRRSEADDPPKADDGLNDVESSPVQN